MCCFVIVFQQSISLKKKSLFFERGHTGNPKAVQTCSWPSPFLHRTSHVDSFNERPLKVISCNLQILFAMLGSLNFSNLHWFLVILLNKVDVSHFEELHS